MKNTFRKSICVAISALTISAVVIVPSALNSSNSNVSIVNSLNANAFNNFEIPPQVEVIKSASRIRSGPGYKYKQIAASFRTFRENIYEIVDGHWGRISLIESRWIDLYDTRPVEDKYIVNTKSDRLTIRSDSYKTAKDIGSLNKGEIVTVYATIYNKHWGRISNTENKWICLDYCVEIKENVQLHGLDNEEKIYNFIKEELHLNTAAACAILGNMYLENPTLDPSCNQIDGPAYGLCQWEGSRKENLMKNYYSYDTLEGQLGFMYDELNYNSTYSPVLNKLQAIDNDSEGVKIAVEIFCNEFEKAGIPKMSERQDKAAELFEKYKS